LNKFIYRKQSTFSKLINLDDIIATYSLQISPSVWISFWRTNTTSQCNFNRKQ